MGTRMLDKTLSALARMNWFGSCHREKTVHQCVIEYPLNMMITAPKGFKRTLRLEVIKNFPSKDQHLIKKEKERCTDVTLRARWKVLMDSKARSCCSSAYLTRYTYTSFLSCRGQFIKQHEIKTSVKGN